MRVNPFFELYVGDRMSSREFVDIFSPFLVGHAEALFSPGNVVVKGVQGSGKSMLLSLLKPEVRLEYARASGIFPVQKGLSKFIGAGINLAHQNAIDFGYRRIADDLNEIALFFADFVNYTVILDLFRTIRMLSNPDFDVGSDLGIDLSSETAASFANALAKDASFQGALQGCEDLPALEGVMSARLNSYRRFLHHNDRDLAEGIRDTKTDIGTPIKATVDLLRACKVIGKNVPVFIHIDQYEELANISSSEKDSPDYRRVINRALARRDPSVSYRIGTRGHAWRNHSRIMGTEAKLEEERDYKFVDLDLLLRRGEDRSIWIFPAFVEDVFARRLAHVGLVDKSAKGSKSLEKMLGRGLEPEAKALRYGGKNPVRSVKVETEWPVKFKQDIADLARENPLSARLLEAWVLQKIARVSGKSRKAETDKLTIGLLSEIGKWWYKERVELALIQIAARCQERPIWSGKTEVIELSAGSVLTFLSICQFIWDTHNQLGRDGPSKEELPFIDDKIQAIGIFKASDYWLKKIAAETGRSGDRFRLVRQMGHALALDLYDDRQMSYPGHNGFSLADEELERHPHVKALLDEMSDYGTLISLAHATKEKDRRSRTKYYLNPILAPHFKMHYKRIKEPAYITPQIVEDWMHEAGLPLPATYKRGAATANPPQLPLFDREPDA